MIKNPTIISQNDFNVNELIKSKEDHQREIIALNDRLKKIEEKFGTHESIAETLSETANKAIKMQTMLSSTFITLLENNDKVKLSLSKAIKKIDREFLSILFNRFGLVVYTLCVSVTSGILGALIKAHI